MTPEKAQYYWMMLRLGLREAYDRELDRLLQEEDPLSPLTLELADSISDVNRTISVLRNHLWARPADQRQVCGLILDDLRRAYLAERRCAEETARALQAILAMVDDSAEPPWVELYAMTYDFELWEEGIISREVFQLGFDAAFLRGQRLDVWAMQRALNQKRPLIDRFRKPK